MKKMLFILVALLFNIATFAQIQTEVVYLKNGSIIKGTIIEQIPNVSLKIQTRDGSLVVCDMQDVKKITKESPNNVTTEGVNPRIKPKKPDLPKKMIFTPELMIGGGDYFFFGHNFWIGYRFNPHVSLMGGIGLLLAQEYDAEYFDYYDAYYDYSYGNSAGFIPLQLRFKVNFINRRVTPFAMIDGGYYCPVTEYAVGVGMFTPSLGLSIRVGRKFSLDFGFGCQILSGGCVSGSGFSSSYNNSYDESTYAFIFKSGFTF